jgi:hypothetical protein
MARNDRDVRVKFTATDQTGKAVSGIEKRLAGLQSAVKRIGAAIGAAFAINKIVAFGRSIFEETAKAQGELARLSGAIENVGAATDTALPSLQRLIDKMADMAGRDDGEVSDALANLITKTGSLRVAQENLALVLDISAKRQIDLGTASDLVTQALNGNERAFKQLGIVTGTHAEKMEELRRRYAGFAEGEGKTLVGQLGRLKNAWDNLKEAIGNALASSANGTPVFGTLADAVVNLTKVVAANPEALQAMGRGMIWVARFAAFLLTASLGAIVLTVELLTEATIAYNEAQIAIGRRMGISQAGAEAENRRLRERLEIIRATRRAADDAANVLAGTEKGKIISATNRDIAIMNAGTSATGGIAGGAGAAGAVDPASAEAAKAVENNQKVAESVEQIGSEAETARAFVEELMRVTSAKGVIRVVAQKAKVKVGENIAHAAEEYAAGTAAAAVGNPAAPVHFAAAKGFALSALKWAAIGAGASAASSSGGGGGASSARADGDRLAGSGRGMTTVIFPAGRKVILDPTNADDVDGFAKFVESLAGQNVQIRYGSH